MKDYARVYFGDCPIPHAEILRRKDHTWIAQDPKNSDYQQYLAWLANGNEPDAEENPAE